MKKVLILITLAMIFAACGTSNDVGKVSTTKAPSANTQSNTQSNTQVNTPMNSEPVKEEVFTSGANPRADIISAAQKLQKLPFWSAKITSETTPEVNAEMQYLAPDRYWIKKADGEVIVIGKDSYSNENGKWGKLDANIGEAIRSSTQTGIEEGVKNLQDVQIVGKEQVNGKDATIYSHKFGDITTKIWIGSDSGLQLKNEVEANVGGKIEKQTTIYDYDKKVSIEAPKID